MSHPCDARIDALRPRAHLILDSLAPSIAHSDALACIDAEILEWMEDDRFAPATVSAYGLAAAAAGHWLEILAGELDDLRSGA